METKENHAQLFEVNIGGLNLKLRSTHDESFVELLTSTINEKLSEVQSSGQDISFQNALILTALNMTEDYLLLKRKAYTDLENLENRSLEILSHLNTNAQSQLDI